MEADPMAGRVCDDSVSWDCTDYGNGEEKYGIPDRQTLVRDTKVGNALYSVIHRDIDIHKHYKPLFLPLKESFKKL